MDQPLGSPRGHLRMVASLFVLCAFLFAAGIATANGSAFAATPSQMFQFFDLCRAASSPSWCHGAGIYATSIGGTPSSLPLPGGGGQSEWAANGSDMVYQFGIYDYTGTPSEYFVPEGFGIYTPGGGTKDVLADSNATEPSISPNGQDIVYSEGSTSIWMMNINGGSPTELLNPNDTEVSGEDPYWTGNNTIVFQGGENLSSFPAPNISSSPSTVTVNVTQLSVTNPSIQGCCSLPVASSDGSTYYSVGTFNNVEGIYGMPAGGGAATVVVSGPDANGDYPTAVLNGQMLYYDELYNNEVGGIFLCSLASAPCSGGGGSLNFPGDPNAEDYATWDLAPTTAPTVTSVAVTGTTGSASGPVAGGTPITITGTGFGAAGATDAVNLVDAAGEAIAASNVVVVNSTTITAVTSDATAEIPAGAASLVTDTEVTAGGLTSVANPPGDQFTYQGITVASVSPSTVSPWGGTPVVVAGTGFLQPNTSVSASFCIASEVSVCEQVGGSDISNLTNTSMTVVTPSLPLPTDAHNADNGAPYGDSSYPINVIVSLTSTGNSGPSVSSANPPPQPQLSYTTTITSITSDPTAADPGQIMLTGSGFGSSSRSDEVFFCVAGTNWQDTPGTLGAGGNDSCLFFSVNPVSDTEIEMTPPVGAVVGSRTPNALTSGTFTTDVFVGAENEIAGPVSLVRALTITGISPNPTGDNPPGNGGPYDLAITGTGLGGAAVICPSGESPLGLTGSANPNCLTEPSLSQTPTSITVPVPTFVLGENGGGFNSENFDVYVAEVASPFYANLTGGGYSPSGTIADVWSNSVSLTLQVAVTEVSPDVIAAGGGTPLVITGSGFGKDVADVSTGPDKVFFCPVGVSPGVSGTSSCTQGTSEVNISDGEIAVVAPPPPAGSNGVASLYVEVVGDDSLSSTGLEDQVIAWSFPQQVTYSVGVTAPACTNLNNCNQGTNSVPGGTATATSTDASGSITATATGTGGVTVGRYSSNPVGTATFKANGSYFDVSISNPNSFTSVEIMDCDLGGGSSINWWNPSASGGTGAWQSASDNSFSPGPPPCVTVTVGTNTSPSLSELTGTVFGVGSPTVAVGLGPPSPPISLAATPGPGEVSLVWDPPTSDGGMPVTSYEVFRWTADTTAALVATVEGDAYVDTGLAAVTYYYDVVASNLIGQSAPSNMVSAIPLSGSSPGVPPPAPPGNPTPVTCAGETANAAFVCALYEDLLGRAPDPGGLATWETLLESGVSRTQVAYLITTSFEYRADLVEHWYSKFLGRFADVAGLAFWVTKLDNGYSDQSVLSGILGSEEFYMDFGATPTLFVTALYEDLLGRAPDQGGLAFWEQKISEGASRVEVAAGVLASNEYLSDFVQACYGELLGRVADPTGLAFWVGSLERGASFESVVSGIAGSPEFYRDATG